MYEFRADRIDLAREYKAQPFGDHSPDLQYLLNLMRSSAPGGHYVLVMTRPHETWTLARMIDQGDRPALPQLTNLTFDNLEDAEWEVFKMRWEALAGRPLVID